VSGALIIRRVSNLSKLIGDKGGRTVMAALRAAEAETADLREEGRALLTEAIAALEAAAIQPLCETWLEGVYRASAGVIDICPPDLPALGKAAWSLCDLADRQRRTGRIDAPPIAVHVAAIRSLGQPGLDPKTAAPLLLGLEALLAREMARAGE
jgi:hypothetical protein